MKLFLIKNVKKKKSDIQRLFQMLNINCLKLLMPVLYRGLGELLATSQFPYDTSLFELSLVLF